MKKLIRAVLAAFLIPVLLAACAGTGGGSGSAASAVPSPERLEHELQALDWPQFRTVVEAIPKLRAQVDAYGPLGWRIVETNYASYPWRRSIEKLDDTQRRQLGELIAEVRGRP